MDFQPRTKVLSIIALVCLILVTFLFIQTTIEKEHIFAIIMITIGILYIHISSNYEYTLKSLSTIFIIATLGSLIIFIPWKNEIIYNIQKHINIYTIIYPFMTGIVSIMYSFRKFIPIITQENIIVLSLSMLYRTFSIGIDLRLSMILMPIIVVLIVYSLYYSIITTRPSKNTVFTLSIFSTLVTGLFALNYLANLIFNYHKFEITAPSSYITGGIEYFLLGTSILYIIGNISLIFGFLPTKHQGFFNQEYYQQVYDLKELHISRMYYGYITPRETIIICMVISTLYLINYFYQFVPTTTAIFFVLFITGLYTHYKYKIITSNLNTNSL